MDTGTAADGPALRPETAQRLAEAQAGTDVSRILRIARLVPGDTGVLEATIQSVSAARTFDRKRGGQGRLCKVVLQDGTGEVEWTLWDQETQWAVDGTLVPGQTIRLLGPTVKPGWRGGIEIALGAGRMEPVAASLTRIKGRLVALGDTRPIQAAGEVRFRAEAEIETRHGTVHVVVWDELVKALRQILPGAEVRLDALRAHPALDGWYEATPSSRLATT